MYCLLLVNQIILLQNHHILNLIQVVLIFLNQLLHYYMQQNNNDKFENGRSWQSSSYVTYICKSFLRTVTDKARISGTPLMCRCVTYRKGTPLRLFQNPLIFLQYCGLKNYNRLSVGVTYPILVCIPINAIIFINMFIFANKTFCIVQLLEYKRILELQKFIIVCNTNVLNWKMLTYVYYVECSCFTLDQSAGSLIQQQHGVYDCNYTYVKHLQCCCYYQNR